MRAKTVRRGAILVVFLLVIAVVVVSQLGLFEQAAWTECETEKTTRPTTEIVDGDAPAAVDLAQVADLPGSVNLAEDASTGDLWIPTQDGNLWRIEPDGEPETVLTFEVSDGNEPGLLGVAVSPDGEHLYVDYTDPDDDTHVVEYALVDGEPDPESRRELFFLEQPLITHNGGTLRFGPDGYLWISVGDGGGAEGQQSTVGRWFRGAISARGAEAQDPSNLYGTLLRIDPTPGDDQPYSIPPDNPFVDDDDARDEIWAYGLRNPWQFSFDRETGDLWIGDVGQVCWEEIDVVSAEDGAGSNFGWGNYEGQHLFEGGELEESVLPLFAADRVDGYCSIVGGHVYRGEAIPELQGSYVFSDSCKWDLMALTPTDTDAWALSDLGVSIGTPVAFAEDSEGELYVISIGAGPAKLVPASS